MKLYFHPVSTTCRPIMLFAADHGLELEYQPVDLFQGEHLQHPFLGINPNGQVPVLEDGDFRLTESAAILRYLAQRCGSDAYPADLQLRARIDERLDWFNTGFYRDFGYGLLYPQLMAAHRHPDDAVHAAMLAWKRDKCVRWLETLDRSLLAPSAPYLCGERLSLADYFGAAILTAGEVIHLDFSPYPRIARWLDRMASLPNWEAVNTAFRDHFVAPFRDARFVTLQA